MFDIFQQNKKIQINDPQFLKGFFDSFPMGVLIADLQGKIIYCNSAQARIDGMAIEEIVGKHECEIYGPYAGPGILATCQQAGAPILGHVCHYRSVHGKLIHGAYWVFPLHDDQDRVSAALCLTQLLPDRDHHFKLQQQLSQEEMTYLTSGCADSKTEAAKKNPSPAIVGRSLEFRRLLSLAETTASSPSPVLISGETGTGKEMLVQCIRKASNRCDKPYQAVNCSAIPSNLLEVILFGSTKGSFTGAFDRSGLFEQANGGIIYLDEIDSMPLELQPKLLRVLQDMRVRRIGSFDERKLDVKVISSISSTPEHVIPSGKMRADLYYRLAVISLRMPALRERMDDLDLLIEHFIDKHNKVLNKNVKCIDPAVKEFFMRYNWPGNIRELEHVIAGAINMTAWETTIQRYHLPEHYKNIYYSPEPRMPLVSPGALFEQNLEREPENKQAPVRESNPLLQPAEPNNLSLQHSEIEVIKQALSRSAGHATNAAKLLGISRQLLNYKLKKYQISRQDFIPDRIAG